MIVGLVPTYREGPLAADAVRSLLPACRFVYVTEGPVGDPHELGSPTDLESFKRDTRVIVTRGKWRTEADKRNAMLQRTRRYPPPVWGVYVDADEVLLHAELVPSLIWAAEQRAEPGTDTAALPLHVVDVDGTTSRVHRIIRLDRLERHVLSMSQLQFIGQASTAVFPNVHVWRPGETITDTARPPQQGEPHLYHRHYLRPPMRADQRLHKLEVADYVEQNRAAIEALGFTADHGTPVHVDRPELIIAMEVDDQGGK